MEEKEDLGEKTYKHPVLFLRKSKAGEHLYAFNVEKKDAEGMVLGNDIGSLLINVSEIEKLLDNKMGWVKVSVLPPRAAEGE